MRGWSRSHNQVARPPSMKTRNQPHKPARRFSSGSTLRATSGAISRALCNPGLAPLVEPMVDRMKGDRMEERSRKRRSDRGPRVTDRDLDALKWIAQQYAIANDHLCILLARLIDPSEYAHQPKEAGILTEKRTTKIVKRWEELGLVERDWILHGDPPWIWLTPEGLRTVAQKVGDLRPYTPPPAKKTWPNCSTSVRISCTRVSRY